MFHENRWAAAFVAMTGENSEALACLKALVPPVKAIPGVLFGYSDSRRLEKLLREGANTAGYSGTGIEYAIRFIALLVEKNHFRHIDSIIKEIEELVNKQNGVLAVTAESASELDSAFKEKLRRQIQDISGAVKVNLDTRLVPELLGGYRLRFGGFYIDASLKGQLKKMKADLAAAASLAAPGGGVITS